jgi:hypothetical protein
MSRKEQATKNINLSHQLATYIAAHPDVSRKMPKHSNYIAFSASDEALNKANEKLIASLVGEGKSIIRAVQTNNKINPWEFFSVAPL